MNPPTRPPPQMLLVHNGSGYEAHVEHLTLAGLRVAEVHADSAVSLATTLQPDIIVLDFGSDGDVVSQLKQHGPTQHIPVIALVELLRPR